MFRLMVATILMLTISLAIEWMSRIRNNFSKLRRIDEVDDKVDDEGDDEFDLNAACDDVGMSVVLPFGAVD